ncbi:glycylpeptide N-tetradecanoyltransferase [Malassezia nana]|uniref:Glycylpeptide N-tetradecanoyltransferase n=1 Tax=Malassezia nana TaxID=180528 RepID=A0AAF0EQQ1_9BASI|nr:glycylpeptide N-tetradecanoyltransferase [Malassezia nana]
MAGDEQRAADVQGGEPQAAAGIKNLARLLSMLGAEDRSTQPAEHKFWKTQPVMQPGDSQALPSGAIQPNVPPAQVRATPLPLPADFSWVTVDIQNDAELREVYDLLTHHYVEDEDATMRFKYSPAFLRWALQYPGYDKSWHVGVRVKSSGKLVAFIAGIPQELRVRTETQQVTEINFLCVHKKLRSKRLAPVLIQEVTRRCNLSGIFQAIYTAGQVLPTPISCARYYHRTLDAAKLLDIGFSAVPRGMSREDHIARFTLPSTIKTVGLREMREADVPAVGRLLRRYMARFDMAPRFTDAEVRHMLVPAPSDDERVTWCYVVVQDGRLTDVVSFYSLPSSVLNHETHDMLRAAYLFYYASDAVWEEPLPSGPVSTGPSPWDSAIAAGQAPWQCTHCSRLTPAEAADERDVVPWHKESAAQKSALQARLQQLMGDVLVLAQQQGFDVVNCLTGMDNALFASDLKFGPGDGFLRFYLFNWRVAPIAGGLGSRANEEALDPAHDTPHPQPPTQWGAGNGVVMV